MDKIELIKMISAQTETLVEYGRSFKFVVDLVGQDIYPERTELCCDNYHQLRFIKRMLINNNFNNSQLANMWEGYVRLPNSNWHIDSRTMTIENQLDALGIQNKRLTEMSDMLKFLIRRNR